MKINDNDVELLIVKEIDSQGIAVCLKPNLPDVITPSLVKEIRRFQNSLAENYFAVPWEGLLYVVWYSHRRLSSCKRGLDFSFIVDSLQDHKEEELECYIKNLFDLLFLNSVGLGLPVVNCSLVNSSISGVFQEFFYLNKINFIKRANEKNPSKTLSQINVSDVAKNLIFPKQIYQDKIYYQYSAFDLKSMRRVIEETRVDMPNEVQLKETREKFDALFQATMASLYHLAASNMNLLKRVAAMQRSRSVQG